MVLLTSLRKRVAVALSLLALLPLSALAQGNLENQVKAAFLYNFTKFVEWPVESAGTDGEMLVCVAGSEGFGQTMQQTLSGKTSRNRQLVSKLLNSPGDVKNCQVLFMAFSEPRQLREWVSAVAEQPVLTVGDAGGFVDSGGMIQFVIVDGKIRFDINQSATDRSQLKISSKLLSLARSVSQR